MKTKLKKIGILVVLGMAIMGCSSSSNPPTTAAACSTVGTDFQNLYNTTLVSNSLYDNYVFMDLVTHEYTFTVSANKTICSIGYQGNAALYTAGIPYTIEIYNNTTSSISYSGNHIFNSAFTDYITPTYAINLIAGNSYTIKRKATNYLGNIGNTIGRICRKNAGPNQFSATSGLLTITSSNFYGTGGPVPNYGIPYIDIVFQ